MKENPNFPKRKERKKRSRSSVIKNPRLSSSRRKMKEGKKKVNNRITRKEKDRSLSKRGESFQDEFRADWIGRPWREACRLFADLKCRAVALPIPRGKRGRAANVILSDPKSCRRLIFDSHLLLPSPRETSSARSSFRGSLILLLLPSPILAY